MARQIGGVTVLATGPAPYYMAALSHLNGLIGGTLAVRYVAASNPKRQWRVPVEGMAFDWKCLSGGVLGQGLTGLRAAIAMLLFLFRRKPSAVVSAGYDDLSAWASLVWCRVFRRRLVLWMESNARDRRSSSRLRTWLKGLFVSQSDAVAALGKAAASYARQLGAQERQIFIAPFGGGGTSFGHQAETVDVVSEKERRGYPSRLILYSGRLVPEKGVFVLLEAIRLLGPEFADLGLLFVGDGPARRDMEGFCECEALSRVFFTGHQPYENMPYFYALADLLVLPTLSDPYGYVVVEAFACGVPAIVSRVAGVADDLVIEGESGHTVEPGDAKDLASKIRSLLLDPALLLKMKENCRRVAQPYSMEACAEGLFAAVTGRRGEHEGGLAVQGKIPQRA